MFKAFDKVLKGRYVDYNRAPNKRQSDVLLTAFIFQVREESVRV